MWSRKLFAAVIKAIFAFRPVALASCKTLATETRVIAGRRGRTAGERLDSGDHCRTPDKQPEAKALSIHKISHNDPLSGLQKYAKPADDEQWLAVKRLVADVRAAGGTYRSYLHEHRKQVLMLRCLATKGRATTTDPVMNFLEQLGDNGVIWKVLSFWPPPP